MTPPSVMYKQVKLLCYRLSTSYKFGRDVIMLIHHIRIFAAIHSTCDIHKSPCVDYLLPLSSVVKRASLILYFFLFSRKYQFTFHIFY